MNNQQKIHTLLRRVNQQSGVYKNNLPTQCWEYQGILDKSGYGRFQGTLQKEYNTPFAHRLSYILHYGEFDKSLDVLHNCDNPCCVNPDHLRLGTHQENMNDRDQRGRQVALRGSNNPTSKLTDETIEKIKQDYFGGKQIKDIAQELGLHRKTISRVLNGETYDQTNIKEERYNEIKQDRENGMSYKQLEEKYGLSRSGLWKIINS